MESWEADCKNDARAHLQRMLTQLGSLAAAKGACRPRNHIQMLLIRWMRLGRDSRSLQTRVDLHVCAVSIAMAVRRMEGRGMCATAGLLL